MHSLVSSTVLAEAVVVGSRLELEVAVTAILTTELEVGVVVAAGIELEVAVAGFMRGHAMLEA